MKCINKSSKEFKDLLKTTTENPVIVATKVSAYLDKYGELPKHYEDVLQDIKKELLEVDDSLDFSQAGAPSPSRLVEDRTYELMRELSLEQREETLEAIFEEIPEKLFKNWTTYKAEYNDERTEAYVYIEPNENRTHIKTSDSAYSVARRMVNAINSHYLHKKFHKDSPVAFEEKMDNGGYKVVIKPSQRMMTFINQFNVSHNSTVNRTQDLYYQRKAIEQLRLEDVFSPEIYDQMIREYKLNDIRLTPEELRMNMEKTDTQKRDSEEGRQLSFFPETPEDSLFSENSSTVDETKVLNIAYYKMQRENQIKLTKDRIQDLYNKRRVAGRQESRVFTKKIKQLEDIVERLEGDIKTAKDIQENPDKVLRKIVMQDIADIKKLQRDPNYDNIFLASSLLNFIEDLTKITGNETQSSNLENPVYSAVLNYKNFSDQSDEIRELISDIGKELSALKSKQEENTTEIFIGLLEKHERALKNFYGADKTIQELKDELVSKIQNGEEFRDTDWLSMHIAPLGSDITTDDLVGKLIRYEYEYNEHKNLVAANKIKTKIDAAKDKVGKELKRLGHSVNGLVNWMEPFTVADSSGDLVLISKYNENWKKFVKENVKNIDNKIVELISKVTGEQAVYIQIDELRQKKYESLNENTDFIDFTKLPEIAEVYPGRKEFDVDEEYAEELKQRLGNTEYKSLIDRQLNMLTEYEIRKAKMTRSFLQAEGVSSLKELSGREQKVLESRQNIMSPYFFVKNMDKGNSVPYVAEGGSVYYNNHSLQFNTFIPKESKNKFFEEKYKKVDSNPILKEYMEILEEAITTINGNVVTSQALAQSKRSVMFLEKTIKERFMGNGVLVRYFKRAGQLLPDSIKWFKDNNSSTIDNTQIKKRPQFKSEAKSFKRVVNKEFKADSLAYIYTIGSTEKKIKGKEFNIDTIPQQDKNTLFKVFAVKDMKDFKREFPDGKFSVEDLRVFTLRRVYENQTLDMPKLIKMLLDQAAVFKAQEQSLDSYTQVIQPLTEKQLTDKKTGIKTGLLQKREKFEKQVLRGDRNTSGWGSLSGLIKKMTNKRYINLPGGYFKENMIGFKNYSKTDKRIVKLYTQRLNEIEKLKKGLTPNSPTLKALKKEELQINQTLDDIGTDYTFGAFVEFVSLKFAIIKALGLSPTTWVKNYIQASQQNSLKAGYRDNDGNLVGDYDDKQLRLSEVFVQKLAIRRNRKEAEKMYAFVDVINVIQDGTDFAQRAERATVQAPTLASADLMAGMSFTEYYNQVPAILSVAQNYLMPDGKPMFNGKEFPYHEMKDGLFKLKEEYLDAFEGFTPEQMKERYETFSDDTATSWSANIKMNVIPRRNGDYTHSGVSGAKSSTWGRVLTVFSNWVYKLLESAVGSNQKNLLTGQESEGYLRSVFKGDKTRNLAIPLILQSAATSYATVALSSISLASLPAIAIPTGTVLGMLGLWAIFQKKQGSNQKQLEGMTNSIVGGLLEGAKNTSFITFNNLVVQPLNMYVQTFATAAKAAGILPGESKPSKWLEKTFAVNFDYTMQGKVDPKSAIALKQLARQTAIMQAISGVSVMFLASMTALGFGDEEDEIQLPEDLAGGNPDALKEAQYYRQKEEEGAMAFKMYMHNLISSAYSDAAITMDPQGLFYNVLKEKDKSNVFGPIPGEMVQALNYGIMGEDVEKPGDMYQGRSKLEKYARKALLPKPIRNIFLDGWFGGMEIDASTNYNKSEIYKSFGETDYKQDRTEWRKDNKKIKLEYTTGDNWRKALEFFRDKEKEKGDYMTKDTAKGLLEFHGNKEYEDLPYKDKKVIDGAINKVVKEQNPTPPRYLYEKETQQDWEE